MTNLRLCNANQLELHSVINSKFPRRELLHRGQRRPRQATREKFEADDERTNLHDKHSRDSSASLSHSQRRRRRFRGNVASLVTIHAAISFTFHGVHVIHRGLRRSRSRVVKSCILNGIYIIVCFH